MPIEQNQDRILLKHPQGPSAEILLYGATVISWKSGTIRSPEPIERLFVSSKAFLDGSKPVRGGIPVVFPCFGAPTHPDHAKLSQHGFARSEIWKRGRVMMDNEAEVSIELTLESTPKIASIYDKPFRLRYVVTLAKYQLSTDLHVSNVSTPSSLSPESFEFQALFHNYIRAPSDEVIITPLQNRRYYDKTDPTVPGRTTLKLEARAEVDVKKYTDFVYLDGPQKYEVTWPDGAIEIKSRNLDNVVIWNPQSDAGSKIADMEPGGWEKFVCIEPGSVLGFIKIDPGQIWTGHQVLSVIHEAETER